MTLPLPHILEMAPYQLAEIEGPDGKRLISMAQNESFRSPSPRVSEAVSDVLSSSALYPDPDWTELRDAISKVHNISADSIVCGAGSMELIATLGHVFLEPGDEVLTTQYAYAFIKTVAQFTGARFNTVPEVSRTVSTDALVSAVSSQTKMVFVANPGNPTGTRIPAEEIRKLRRELPDDILLVVDEAYGEFSDDPENQLFDLTSSTNTIILRTFSKAYSLAGMRVGWGCFPKNISEHLRKILNPNNVSLVSQKAATAAMHDQAYMLETCRITRTLREQFIEQIRRIGIEADDSHTNFVLLRFKHENDATHADQSLKSEGILMRKMGGYGLGNCLRATIVAAKDMELAINKLCAWRNGEGSDA